MEKTYEFSENRYYGQVVSYLEKISQDFDEQLYYNPVGVFVCHRTKDNSQIHIQKTTDSKIQLRVFSEDKVLLEGLGNLEKFSKEEKN